jgi:hypothetical protein
LNRVRSGGRGEQAIRRRSYHDYLSERPVEAAFEFSTLKCSERVKSLATWIVASDKVLGLTKTDRPCLAATLSERFFSEHEDRRVREDLLHVAFRHRASESEVADVQRKLPEDPGVRRYPRYCRIVCQDKNRVPRARRNVCDVPEFFRSSTLSPRSSFQHTRGREESEFC